MKAFKLIPSSTKFTAAPNPCVSFSVFTTQGLVLQKLKPEGKESNLVVGSIRRLGRI